MGKFFRFYVKDKNGNIGIEIIRRENGKFVVRYGKFKEIATKEFRGNNSQTTMTASQLAMLIFAYSESEYFRFVEEMEKFYKELDENEC